jgi:GAF domain-containing protein
MGWLERETFMSEDSSWMELTGPQSASVGGSVERQHLHTVISQVDELIRRGETDPESALLEIIKTSAVSVPGAQHAGVTIVEKGGQLTTLAATHDFAKRLDDVQREACEGPCLSAVWNQHTIHIDDLATDHRWPRYRDIAVDLTPVRSILSFRLFDDGGRLGALSFYADKAGAFTEESIEVGLVFAAHTTMAWNSMRREQQFQSALASRDMLGQAKGILMERFNINAMTAFELLRNLSQKSNTKVAEIAERLVAIDYPSS